MFSEIADPASLSAESSSGNAPLIQGGVVDTLQVIDGVIWWTGLLVGACALIFWLRKGRQDPLAGIPERPNRLMPEHVFALMLGYVLVAASATAAVQQWGRETAWMLSTGNMVQLVGGVACLLIAQKLFEGGAGCFVWGKSRIGGDVVLGIIALPVAMTACSVVYQATDVLMHLIDRAYEGPQHTVIDALRDNSEPAWLLRLGAVLIAPLAEELFFRGLVQTMLRSVLKKPWAAVVLTGLLFGLAHSQQPQVVPALAILGMILGAAYERTGSLTAPMTIHILFNLKTVIWEAAGAVS